MPTEEEIRELFAVHTSEFAASERLLRSYGLDAQRLWVGDGGYRLSDSVWRARKQTRDQIDLVLRQAVAEGTDALEVARILEDHLNPSLSPIRNVRGRLVRNQPRGIVTHAPGRAGMGSFAARRLARTEITRAHGAATMWAAERTPFAVGVKWSTSGRHPKADECDAKAERDTGLGAGVYAVKDVPRYPSHPQCLCNLSTATVDDVDAVVAGLRDKYGLEPEAGEETSTTGREVPTFRTSKDLAKWLQEGGVAVDGTPPLTPEAMDVIARSFRQEWDAGREVVSDIRFIRKKTDKVLVYYQGREQGFGGADNPYIEVYYQNDFWKDPAARQRAQAAKGWWASDDPLSQFVHEFGHHRHYQRLQRVDDPYVQAYITPAGHRIEGKSWQFRTDRGEDWERADLAADRKATASKVSRYATTEPVEFVAETYAGLVRGITYTPDVMQLYRELGGPEV